VLGLVGQKFNGGQNPTRNCICGGLQVEPEPEARGSPKGATLAHWRINGPKRLRKKFDTASFAGDTQVRADELLSAEKETP
jgi:hypothetical protein